MRTLIDFCAPLADPAAALRCTFDAPVHTLVAHTPAQVRPLLARYARLFAPGLHVLSYNEIPENREVSIVGTVG